LNDERILRGAALRNALTLVVAGAVALAPLGCGKKKEEKPISAPPPRGAASIDELTTGLGVARGLDANLAPTSTEWRRVLVFDDKHAILAGDIANDAVALVTTDAGKTWRSLRSERDGWSSWGIGADGTAVLTIGAREQPRVKTQVARAPADSMRLLFAPPDALALSAPWPLIPPQPAPAEPPPKYAKPPPKSYAPIDVMASVLSPDSAAFVLEDGPRKFSVAYGGPPGSASVPALKLPPTERFIPVPFGRPPLLLSVRGRDLLTRPMPAAGKPLDAPQKVPNVVVTPAVINELSLPPQCEAEGWSFRAITQPPARMLMLAVSSGNVATFPLPQTTSKTTRIGCGSGKVVVETVDAKTNTPTLAVCDLEGACVTPKQPPFRLWTEAHQREITTTPTALGVAAVMSSQAGERWGLYFAQSVEAGAVYEVSRVIGEGTSDRGKMDLGALISFGKRTLILLSADVTGTSRRGWYVIISDDGGLTWTTP
jgi:hypothetical protein